MSISLTFEITLLTDYHVGAGQRFGPTVDAALLRDYDNAPVLRGTMLVGLLRDSLTELKALATPDCTLLNNSEQMNEVCIRLFGQADSPKRWAFSSAHTATNTMESERWGSTDVTRVRIDPRTRRAADKQLFSQEEGDSRLKFSFTATCEGATPQNKADAALLVACTRLLRHFGAARRRGRGQCRVALVAASGIFAGDDPQLVALDAFKSIWLEADKLPSDELDSGAWKVEKSAEIVRYRIAAYTVEPVLIAQRSQAGNTLESGNILTGTALLGALASRAARRMGLKKEASQSFIDLFLRGNLRLSDLLPAERNENGHVTISLTPPRSFAEDPTEPAFEEDPEDSGKLYDLRLEQPSQGKKVEPIGDRLRLDNTIQRYNVTMREEAHIEIDRDTQRVSKGQLFEYIVIEAGQWFVGEISLPKAWVGLLKRATDLSVDDVCELRLGKATRRGYGLTRCLLEEGNSAHPLFATQPLTARVKGQSNTQTLSLLLMTDAILFDQWQRPLEGFTSEWASTLFPDHTVQFLNGFSRPRTVDSFNTHRRMPRWRDVALVAGSVATLRVDGISDWNAFNQRLADLERDGIGLRRSEGFGRIVFNHPVFPQNIYAAPTTAFSAAGQDKLLQTQHAQQHRLIAETKYRKQWQQTLDKHDSTLREQLKVESAPIARLLYLYRYRPLNELLQWLEADSLAQPSYLWGEKTLHNRAAKEPLSSSARKIVRDLLQELVNRSEQERATAITALAEQISLITDRENS